MSSFEFKYWIRRFGALALIPIENLKDAWQIIMNTLPIPLTDNLSKFIKYFIDVWIIGKKGSNFSPEVWNCHECMEHRTNNKPEGYHSKLQKDINSKPDIYTIIRYLKKIDSDENNNYLRRKNFITTNNAKKIRAKDKLKEEKLAKIQKEYLDKKLEFREYFDALTMHVTMPYSNDEEVDELNQNHQNEQKTYNGYLSDAYDVSDDSGDDDNDGLLEKKSKKELFENPFKDDTWFYMKKLDDSLLTSKTIQNNSDTTETATDTSKKITKACENDNIKATENILIIGKHKRKLSLSKKIKSPKKIKTLNRVKSPKKKSESTATTSIEHQTTIKDFLKPKTIVSKF